jgi:uncharacterized protein YjiS (DUF1127 family)
MTCSSWTRADGSAPPTADAALPRPTLAGAVGSLLARGWRAYWDWHLRRTTVLILQSLSPRTLHDIGIHASEIESVACDAARDRRRRLGTRPDCRDSASPGAHDLRGRWMSGQ